MIVFHVLEFLWDLGIKRKENRLRMEDEGEVCLFELIRPDDHLTCASLEI